MQNEYLENGYSFRSEMFLINNTLLKQLISKAFGLEFLIITDVYEDEFDYKAVRLKHTGVKTIPYKFNKSVKYSLRSEKAGKPEEIKDNLFTLKNRYKAITKIEDIIHCETHIEIRLQSETDRDLHIIFKLHPENTSLEFAHDLSIRFHREFFEYQDPNL